MQILFSLLFFLPVFANESSSDLLKKPPQLISLQKEVKKGETFEVGIHIKIPENWYTYWSFSGDFGQAPSIRWKSINGIKIEPLPFPRPKRKKLTLGEKPFYSFIYEKELFIPFQISVTNQFQENHLPLHVDLEWFVCKEVCLSEEASLQLNLKIGDSKELYSEAQKIFDFWRPFYPKKINIKSRFTTQDNKLLIDFVFKKNPIQCLDVFPKKNEDFASSTPLPLNQTSNSCSFALAKSSSNLKSISGLLLYAQEDKVHSVLFESHKEKGLGILWFILMAFAGGLILNFMPCVLPIIFLKFYNLLEFKSFSPGKILFLNLIYALGVILSFLILAFIIFISKQTGNSLGWGFHLQSPVFVTFLAVFFAFIAFSFLNVVSFSIPKVHLLFKDEKWFSHFITGMLSTTAASPCTVPFMASAVGFAFSRSYVEIFIIFFFLGLGLSSPYIILSFFPGALKHLPTPGYWSEVLKKLMSIPLFLTSVWLLRVLYLQVNLKIFLFSLGAFFALFIWIFLQKKTSSILFKRAAATLIPCFIIGFFILQKASYNSVKEKTSFNEIDSSQFKSQYWLPFDTDQLVFDKQKGKKIFIAFGAEWCLTCKFNERIFKNQKFIDIVKKKRNPALLWRLDTKNKKNPLIFRSLQSIRSSLLYFL